MDSVVLVPSVALGLLFLFAHLYLCIRRKQRTNIGVMINAFLQSSGIICGLFLMTGSVYAPAKEYLKGIDIYIFIAGLAVLIVSIQSVHKDIFSKNAK